MRSSFSACWPARNCSPSSRRAVRLIQPAHAFRYKCVPLVVQDRQLIAAIEDPHDFATLEAITQATGYRVLPRIAPELRIYYYIERYYGVPRPVRGSKLGRFSGCASVPTSKRAVSRGSCVSVSRVMTYLIDGRIVWSPTMAAKFSLEAPLKRALNCINLPRLRS